ncbi:hypothetical protein H5410_030994 [Solanum commersonii]|uniref:F-box protein n=1 Tax=Solanum commersonii TaxID=4109 RepID=A0A9J5YIZ6_SOLCO|nr:hypothetical protein H5410_030994 [Solanum commersonii]
MCCNDEDRFNHYAHKCQTSPIHQFALLMVLPDELLFEILSKMTPYTLGRAACVCRKRRYTIRNPVFWRNACLKSWQVPGTLVLVVLLALVRLYDGSWRKMLLLKPKLCTDVKDVAKYLNFHASKADCVFKGSYTLSEDKVEAALLYPGTCSIVLRFRLRSSNSPGQINILERTIVFLNCYYICLNTY